MSAMNPDLTPAVIDEVIDPTPPARLAGDWTDDDGPALDSYFEAMPTPPVRSEGVEIAKESTAVATRLITSRINLLGVNDAVQLLTRDLNRTYLMIQEITGLGIFFFNSESFTSDGSGLPAGMMPGAAYIVNATNNPLELTDYTGEVWVAASTAAACTVQATAITK